MRVLIVDDDAFDRAYLEAVFTHRGDQVVTAPEGTAGLAEARAQRPDMVISDVLMPGTDGYRFCRSLRQDPDLCDIPFIFYTATYTDPEDEKLAGDLGADAFAVKPLEPSELTKLVDEVMARRALGGHAPAVTATVEDEYSEAVVRKLEQTVSKLETANRDLARYHLLFEQAFDATLFVTRDLTILEANPAAAERFGYSRAELAGMNLQELQSQGPQDRTGDLLATIDGPVRFEGQGLRRDGSLFPFEVRARAVSLGGGQTVLVVIARDQTEQRRQEDELKTMVDQFEALAFSAVDAFGKVIEKRDPYTAGHQERVADMAAALAARLGFSTERCQAVRLAGLVHDVGKIVVPSEILNKPGKLSDLEFSLIKTHVQMSYDILSDIDFPWPIAPMAYQHHERMDGSGYPNGLHGDEIMIEARILAVSDVVEAMTFHRPYKTVLGLDRAIEEIMDNAGRLYDQEVADACYALFVEDGYVFPAIAVNGAEPAKPAVPQPPATVLVSQRTSAPVADALRRVAAV